MFILNSHQFHCSRPILESLGDQVTRSGLVYHLNQDIREHPFSPVNTKLHLFIRNRKEVILILPHVQEVCSTCTYGKCNQIIIDPDAYNNYFVHSVDKIMLGIENHNTPHDLFLTRDDNIILR